jgi:uncharacterized Fe-S cluster-containing radical SAM superfamily protein
VRAAPGENLTVLEPSRNRKTRHALRASGASCGLDLRVHNNTLVNVLRAIRERVFAVERGGVLVPPPRPDRRLFAERMAAYRAALVNAVGHCTPWSFDKFLSTYRGSKLLRYTSAVMSLRIRGVTKRDSFLQAFVKAEAVNFTAKPDPAPRLIQPRHPRYNACVGRYLRSIEHRVYDGIAKLFGGPTVMKGYNAQETAAKLREMWDGFDQPIALSLDASRFDQHVSVPALQFEHSVYNRLFNSAELARLLRWQLDNTGFARTSDGAKVTYRVKGCRMSGDMNTALGNCLLMCGMVWTYARECGVRIRLANNGDDCSVIMERRDLTKFVANMDKWFLGMGFTLTSEGVAEVFERIDFCQTRPVLTSRGWVMCRSPRLGLCKDGLCKHPDMGGQLAGYLRWSYQVGLAGQALAAGVPVFRAAYDSMVRLGIKSRRAQGFGNMESGFEYMSVRMSRDEVPISQEARYSFWTAWGITPDQQVALEETYANMTQLTSVGPMMSAADNHGIWFYSDSFIRDE